MTADESEAAREDLWLTYQNYDPAVKQAVRRLGALPGNNVEEFRNLLLASRERSRAKEFEADVVRRLQGEAFVDDEVLQQTLIVLHAEDPHLAEAFKTFVAANGRPDDIDLAVARLRSGTDNPVMPEREPRKLRETPIMSQLIAPELPPESTPVLKPPVPAPAVPQPRVAQADFPTKAPRPANDIVPDRSVEPASRPSWTKYAIAAVILLAGIGGFYVLTQKSADKPPAAFQATDVPLRQVAAEDKQPAAGPVVAPEQPAPAQSATAETAPVPPEPAQAATEARNEVIPAPPPEAPAPQAAAAPVSTNNPVPGSRYRVAKGDMLSAIALEAYGDASMFRLIQRANPQLRSADRIYYDQMISLPPKP